MRTVSMPVKCKGEVVGEATFDLPESLDEAKGGNEPELLACMHYGIRVKACNTVRSAATGGPKSVSGMIAAKLKGMSEDDRNKIMKMLDLEVE